MRRDKQGGQQGRKKELYERLKKLPEATMTVDELEPFVKLAKEFGDAK